MKHDLASPLIIRAEPLAKILLGRKTSEICGRAINKRSTIGLIEKCSKTIVGVADLVDCRGPLSREEILANVDKDGNEPYRVDSPEVAKRYHAWVPAKVIRLRHPVPYRKTPRCIGRRSMRLCRRRCGG